MFLYYLTFLPSGHFYIGSTSYPDKRLKRHLDELEGNKHHNSKMQTLFNTKTVQEIRMVTLECRDRQEAYEKEDAAIKSRMDDELCLNIGKSSRGGDNLSSNPNKPEIVRSIGETLRKVNSMLSVEERRKKFGKYGARNGMFGRTHTEEVRKRLSKAHKGKSSPFKGTKVDRNSQQYKNFIKGIEKRDYRGEKNPFFGKRHPDEILLRIREANRRRLSDPNYINPKSKVVCIKGIEYKNVREASEKLRVKYSTVAWRCRNKTNPDFKDWIYKADV